MIGFNYNSHPLAITISLSLMNLPCSSKGFREDEREKKGIEQREEND